MERWQLLLIPNASITWLQINKNGYITVVGIGDVGHMPRNKLTNYNVNEFPSNGSCMPPFPGIEVF